MEYEGRICRPSPLFATKNRIEPQRSAAKRHSVFYIKHRNADNLHISTLSEGAEQKTQGFYVMRHSKKYLQQKKMLV